METTISRKTLAGIVKVVVIAIFMVFLSTGIANANSTNNVVDLGKNNATLNAITSEVNKSSGKKILKYSSSSGILSFNNQLYADFDTVEKREYMSDTLGYVKNASLNDRVKNKMFNFIADQDTTSSAAIRNLKVDSQANLASASSIMKPFSGGISIALGVISILILMFLGLSTVLDVAYIALPFARVAFSSDDNKKPLFLTGDAWASVTDSEQTVGSGHYQSAIGMYFRRRLMTLIVISVCIIYLVTGQIFDLVGWFIDVFAPAFEK